MSQELATRYPLVLVPGMLGFIRLLWFPYWYGITPALRAGGATVFPVQVSPLHCNEVRGEQLLLRIEQIRRETGAQKVNLIGHSQGSLTARYAAARRPEWVASVTSVAGPNHGSELADHFQRHYPPTSARGRLLTFVLCAVARLMGWLETGYRGPALPMDLSASHHSLTSDGVAPASTRRGYRTAGAAKVLNGSMACVTTPGPGFCSLVSPIVGVTCSTAPIAVAACSPKPSFARPGSAMAWSGATVRTWGR